MKKRKFKKTIILSIIITLIFSIIFVLLKKEGNKFIDYVIYKGEKYICLEYNMDIFTYNFNSNSYYEEDIIQHISHDEWDMVYFNGDLFIHEAQVKDAIKYYWDDKNYEWFIMLDENDTEVLIEISLTKEEIEYIYDMDNMYKNKTMTFEEIQSFASLTKISKDKKVFSLISLVLYKNSWYWKTEIIDDTQEGYHEYIIELPESLNIKISKLIEKY